MLALVAVMASVTSCTGDRMVFGNIPPETFQFVTVKENRGKAPGGWQVARVIVLLGRISTMFPRTAVCRVEVGVPVVNKLQGFISEERAQEASANASDRAARELFQERHPVASICLSFRQRMTRELSDPGKGGIAGARVSQFGNWREKESRIPRKTFPPRRGH